MLELVVSFVGAIVVVVLAAYALAIAVGSVITLCVGVVVLADLARQILVRWAGIGVGHLWRAVRGA